MWKIKCNRGDKTIQINYKIIILFFGVLNLLLILWATKVLAPLKDIFYKEKKTDILIIEPLKEDIKEKPDEIELFPHSDSSIWDAFEKPAGLSDKDNTLPDKKVLIKKNEKNKIELESKSKENKKNEKTQIDFNNKSKKNQNEENDNKKNYQSDADKSKIKSLDNKDKSYNGAGNLEISDTNESKTKLALNYYIQVASLKNVQLINKEWKRLQNIYPELLNQEFIYKKVILKDGKTFYRLLVGGFATKSESKEFCKVSLKNSACIIKFYE